MGTLISLLYRLLVMSPLGFKARVGSLIRTWWGCTYYTFLEIHLLCITCWPLGSQHGSWAILYHVPVSRHWWGSKPGPIMQPLSPIPFIFMQFSENILPNNRLAYHLWGWRPLWEILDPPLLAESFSFWFYACDPLFTVIMISQSVLECEEMFKH